MKLLRHFFRHLESPPWLFALALVFRVALEMSYQDFVFPIYEYAGFLMNENPVKYAESWVLYIGILVLLPARARRPSDYLMCLAFFAFMAPLLVFYGLSDASRWVLYFVLVQYALMGLVRRGRQLHCGAVSNGPSMALGISIAGIIVATSWMIASVGSSTFNLDFDAVYDFREVTTATIYTGFLGYIVVWATTVCGPFLLMLALRRRRHVFALGVLFIHVVWFGFTSHKAVLFYPVLVMSLYILFKYSRALSLIPIGMTLVVMMSLINYLVTDSLFLSGMLVRRVFFVPSHLTFSYFEFFDQNPFVFWSNSLLSGFIRDPYGESVATVIGYYVANDPGLWANNSFFSTGYMHAGLLGVVIYGLTAGALLRIVDSIANRGVPTWMSLSVVIVPFYSLFTSSDLTTTLMTHGLGFALLMLYLLRRPGVPDGFEFQAIGNSEISTRNERLATTAPSPHAMP